MKTRPPFNELIKRNLTDDPAWLSYMQNAGPLPELPASTLPTQAIYLFYAGYLEHAREVSRKYSVYGEEQSSFNLMETGRAWHAFDAALYRSLSAREDEAMELFRKVVALRNLIPVDQVLRENRADLFIHEAYSQFRLKQYQMVLDLVKTGIDGINQGKSYDKVPNKNTRTYRLATLLEKLVNYQITKSSDVQKEAQNALLLYKRENFLYYRSGYDIIFDLQFSYPDILDPVLPSSNPEED